MQGDVIAILDASGSVVARYSYDAWGAIFSVTDANGTEISDPKHIANCNPFRYRGYMYDQETGLYYLRTRYYDPVVGRFLNADDPSLITATPNALTDKNLYAYCDNNPVMRSDDGGKFWKRFKSVGESILKASIVVAGITAAVAITALGIIGTIYSGGAGAGAIPIVLSLADMVLMASVSAATVGATAVAVGGIGESVTYSRSTPKGKSFRGGKKSQRDQWYGHNERAFQKWYERVGKGQYNNGMDIDCKATADKLYEIWKELGSPFPK